MNMWQKCPVCDGSGLVSRPPWVAGDLPAWVGSGTGPSPCRTCGGCGVVTAPDQRRDAGPLRDREEGRVCLCLS